LVKIIAEKAKYAGLRVIRIHSTSWPRSINLHGLPSFGASSFGHIKRRLPRIHLHGIQASESKLQAAESKPAPASSNLHASFVTSISTESKHQSLVTSVLHASPSHPPQRDPSIEFRSHQSSTPVRRIHLQEIQASHFGHFNPPSTSNWRRSMRSKSHHLRVIHVCCEQWSRMRARARTNLLQMRCNCQVRAGARFQ